MSILSRLFQKIRTKKDLEHDDNRRKTMSSELNVYFTPKPNDPVWKAITYDNVEAVQNGFTKIWQTTNLDKYHNTNDLPQNVIDLICEISNEIGETINLNPVFTLLLAHQYVDADQVMRRMYRSRWVAFMVDRSTYAPPPEAYRDYIKSTYFSGA